MWQADPDGLYDSQRPELEELHMRGIFHCDAEGRYIVRTTRPVHYQIPSDGPVGSTAKTSEKFEPTPFSGSNRPGSTEKHMPVSSTV